MRDSGIEEFAEHLIKCVRDRAIESYDGILIKNMKSPTTRKYVELFGDQLESAVVNIVPDVVDTTIFYLLKAIENQELAIIYKTQDGEVVDLDERGLAEMAGNYITDDAEGWRQKFSHSRIF